MFQGFRLKGSPDHTLFCNIIPEVDYVEPDLKVKAFVQSLPTGIDRVDADLSSTKSGDGSGAANADIGILYTGIDLSHPDLNVYRQVDFHLLHCQVDITMIPVYRSLDLAE